MGYEVRIVESSVVLPRDKLDQIFAIWKHINDPKFNHLKSGGSFSGGTKTAYWYSFMDEDYDNTAEKIDDILTALRFSFEYNQEGGIGSLQYDTKTGDEDLFFISISHLIPPGIISWIVEDGDRFDWVFDGKTMDNIDDPYLNCIDIKI